MADMQEQAPLPFYEQGLPELDRYQRIEVLGMPPEGFLPVTKTEQVEFMGLQAVINRSSGVSRHLAEVTKSQNKVKEARDAQDKLEGINPQDEKTKGIDPQAASRKIVHNYVDWARDAHTTGEQLEVLTDEIADINPGLRLNEPDLLQDIGRMGLLKFMRFYDLSVLRETADIRKVGYDPQKVDYDVTNGGIMAHLEMAQDSWTVGQVKRKLGLARQDAANRFMFWTPRLVEVTKHSPKQLQAIAHDGLDKIYGREAV